MIKKYAILSVLSLIVTFCNSQDFSENLLDNDFELSIRAMKNIDINGDNLVDIVALKTGSTSEPFRIFGYLNNGDETFEKINIIAPENSDSEVRDFEFVDINNDGILDIISAFAQPLNNNPNLLFIDFAYAINNNDGTFEPYVKITDSILPWDRTFTLIDMDNNGLEDILFIKMDGNFSYEYIPNLGNGTFGTPIQLNDLSARGVQSADFDNDGLEDFIGEIAVREIYLNNGNSTFNTMQYPAPPSEFQFSSSRIVTGNIDNNDSEDLLINGVGINSGLVWYSNDGNGDFTFEKNFNVTPNQATSGAHIADLNNDNQMDILTGVFTSGFGIPYWINQGSNDYSVKSTIETENDFVSELITLDINNDGKTDIVAAGPNGIYWYKNNITLSIEDIEKTSISIVPTISNGVYTINNYKYNNVFVYDNLGRSIPHTLRDTNKLDIKSAASGVYFVQLTTENSKIVKRVIKN